MDKKLAKWIEKNIVVQMDCIVTRRILLGEYLDEYGNREPQLYIKKLGKRIHVDNIHEMESGHTFICNVCHLELEMFYDTPDTILEHIREKHPELITNKLED